jgi:hypothetical protein
MRGPDGWAQGPALPVHSILETAVSYFVLNSQSSSVPVERDTLRAMPYVHHVAILHDVVFSFKP